MLKIPLFFNKSQVSWVGHNTLKIFLDASLHKTFLKKFNFGYPEILKINFVSKLKKINKNNGKEVSKWIIKKFDLFLFKKKNNGNNENKKLNIYINLLAK